MSAALLRDRLLQAVARLGLVQRQRQHLPFRPRLRLVQVHEEVGRPRAVWRAGVGIRGGHVGRDGVRNRRDAVREPRRRADHLHQLRIDALGHRSVTVQQVFGRLEVEPRVGPEVREELRQRAREAGLRFDLLHRGLDARDLLQPDLVDLLRREVGRRVQPRQVGVAGEAAARLPPAHLVVAGGEVVLCDEVAQPRKGRDDVRAHALEARCRQACLIGSRDVGSGIVETDGRSRCPRACRRPCGRAAASRGSR